MVGPSNRWEEERTLQQYGATHLDHYDLTLVSVLQEATGCRQEWGEPAPTSAPLGGAQLHGTYFHYTTTLRRFSKYKTTGRRRQRAGFLQAHASAGGRQHEYSSTSSSAHRRRSSTRPTFGGRRAHQQCWLSGTCPQAQAPVALWGRCRSHIDQIQSSPT